MHVLYIPHHVCLEVRLDKGRRARSGRGHGRVDLGVSVLCVAAGHAYIRIFPARRCSVSNEVMV
jgi:hypothetical protein